MVLQKTFLERVLAFLNIDICLKESENEQVFSSECSKKRGVPLPLFLVGRIKPLIWNLYLPLYWVKLKGHMGLCLWRTGFSVGLEKVKLWVSSDVSFVVLKTPLEVILKINKTLPGPPGRATHVHEVLHRISGHCR